MIDAAEIITSELVTNAVRATGTTDPQAGYVARGNRRMVFVRLRQYAERERLIIEVWDSSVAPPTIRASDEKAEGGRGMVLVAELSEKWGAWRVPPGTGDGKVVWAELSTAPEPDEEATPEAEPVAAPMPGPVAPRPGPGQAVPRPQPGPVAPRPGPGHVTRPGQVPRPGPGHVPRPGQAGPRPGPVAPGRRPVVLGQGARPVAIRRRGAAAPGPVATRPRPVAPVPLWEAPRKPQPYRPPGGWRTDLKPAEFEQIIDALAALSV